MESLCLAIGKVDLLCSYEVLGINKMPHPTDHRDPPPPPTHTHTHTPSSPSKKKYNSSRNVIRETSVKDLFIPTVVVTLKNDPAR